MVEMTIDEVKSCAIGVLDFIDSVCKQNGLQYFLCGGTLLGAVRHKGFIPWDDDIDIHMPRKDYERLFEVWPKESFYHLLNYKNTPHFPYAFAKAIDSRTLKIEDLRKQSQLIGVDVDIFALDNLPEDEEETIDFFDNIKRFQAKMENYSTPFRRASTFPRTIARTLIISGRRLKELLGIESLDAIVKSYSEYAQRYSEAESEYIGVTSISHYGVKEKNPKSNFADSILVSFEGKEYPAPIGYADVLRRVYGDNYMQLPPVEMRKTHHHFKAYWK